MQAFAFPGTVYSIALFINLFLSYKRSSLAVPLTTLITLFMLWFGVSVPLTFAGSYLGFKREEIRHPVRVNNIPRQIPAQPWYLHPVPSVLVGGILPFGAVFIELYFIMSAVWLAQVRQRGGALQSGCGQPLTPRRPNRSTTCTASSSSCSSSS